MHGHVPLGQEQLATLALPEGKAATADSTQVAVRDEEVA
jgi:hypothetical protein